MPYNKTKYLVVVQPTSETKGSLFDLKMAFSGKGDKRSVACETIEPDEPFEPVPVRVKVIYAQPKTPIYKG